MMASATDLLAKLIHQKHDCLVQVHELGRQQGELIAGGDIAQLHKLLGAKQRLLGELQRLEKALDPFGNQPPGSRFWRSRELREACARLLRRCEALLGEIVAQETEGETHLRRRRDDTAAGLQGHHPASRARGAYIVQGRGVSGRLDLSTES